MAKGILDGMRVVEGSAFVALPLAGVTLAQMGADVIRFDPIGGGLDYTRWPITNDGRSLFWAGFNKAKRSLAVDLRSPRGQEILTALICAPGENAGMFITNFPARGWLDYEKLKAQRADLIMVNLTGRRDGSSQVDYTVNPAVGFPAVTGPTEDARPVNHQLPAWDAMAGNLTVASLLAAERHRRLTGEGQFVKLALHDVALAMLGNIGLIGEVVVNDAERLRDGTRKIVNITEVAGMEGDVVTLTDLFLFEQTGYDAGKVIGRLRPTGLRPKFMDTIEAAGIHLPPQIFGIGARR